MENQNHSVMNTELTMLFRKAERLNYGWYGLEWLTGSWEQKWRKVRCEWEVSWKSKFLHIMNTHKKLCFLEYLKHHRCVSTKISQPCFSSMKLKYGKRDHNFIYFPLEKPPKYSGKIKLFQKIFRHVKGEITGILFETKHGNNQINRYFVFLCFHIITR